MGLLADLLSWVDSRKRVAGRNIRDLINDPAAALENTGYQAALEMKDPSNYGPGALKGLLGMTAWHGSPHLFDRFSLDKIGTGEGAQAYGHGLYLAESPHVAQNYQKQLTERGGPEGQAAYMKRMYKDNALDIARQQAELPQLTPEARKYAQDVVAKLEGGDLNMGALYKTDIPDEAVARFLDWDKPLSQQAPEVQIALKNMQNKQTQNVLDSRVETFNKLRASGQDTKRVERSIEILKEEIANPELQGTSGEGFYKYLRNRLGEQNLATDQLRQYGIPGIRYLDGGSRSTGQGSSNFVAFDPEMIRILERNGQPTGLQPWKPGEYKLRDLLSPN